MSAHVVTEPPADLDADPATPTASTPAEGAGRWDAFARALSDEAVVIADRDDLLVTIAPGAGHGAPACFLPATATIELDATHLGELDPDTATPDQDSDRVRYRIGWVCWCTSAPTPNTPAGTNLSAARQ